MTNQRARNGSIGHWGLELGHSNLSRRRFCQTLLAGAAGLATGCDAYSGNDFGRLDKVWGRQGFVPGRFGLPRAMAIDADDNLYIIDKLARIQVFNADGEPVVKEWRTPEWKNGKPTGMSFDRGPMGDRLLVADTHYYRILSYTLDGQLMEEETLGGVNGKGPGEFGWVTDAHRDSTGCLYVAQYGDNDRIQKFSPEGEYLLEWGAHGGDPGQFRRPQNLIIDPQDRIWVCDACNHRMQVFDASGDLLFMWGEEGSGPGQLYYPYDAVLDPAGDLYVVEYGNSRIQKFNQQGESLGSWGSEGRAEGQLWNPWSAVLDSRGRLHVLDSNNHRVQRVLL